MRIFCAIELNEKVRSQIEEHIKQLQQAVADNNASWSRVENIHLTLKFFGNVAESRLNSIASAATRVTKDFSPFEISIEETGSFPKPSQARVLWIGVKDPGGKLGQLQKAFESECEVEGFPKEDREFRPHLTIARIRKPFGARQLAEANKNLGFESLRVVVNELVVFRSELSSKGSKYTALSRHQLSG